MDKLIIIGAGGLGREVAWLVERINANKPTWDIIGFIDDNEELHDKNINGYSVLGTINDISNYMDCFYVCAIGASVVRKKTIEKAVSVNPNIKFATLIDPTVEMSNFVNIGEGSVICAHTIITVNISIGKHVIINPSCNIGHDAVLKDYVILYPNVKISGTTEIGECTELGVGMQIIQGKKIGANSIVGAGAVVIHDIPNKCTAVGVPAEPIKCFE